jgi:cyclase
MKHFKVFSLVFLAIVPAVFAFAQEEPVFKVTPLSDNIYELSTDGGGYTVKVIASVGDDGILIVDAGQKKTGEELKKTLATLGDSIPEIIINTHAHVEHTGGNTAFGRKPVIIGHTMLRKTLRSGSYLFDEFPDEALPEITFDDSLTIHFNGEEIRLLAFPGAHDNSDIIIWFTGSKVVCVGALSNGRHFPSVDGTTGNILLYPVVVKRLLDILPEDVTIVPGHGETGTMAEFRAFYDMLVGTEAVIRDGLKQGKTLEQLQEEDALKEWSSFEGSYVDKNDWIKYLVKGIEGDHGEKELRVAFFETMYRTYKEYGADAALKKLREINDGRPADKKITEIEPVIIGFKLFENKKFADAIKFFEFSAKEFPDGDYPWLCYNNIGTVYRELGDKEQAIKYYKMSLELNPDNTRAAERIKELESD